MKETKTVELARKHREDVIDTLQLRHKERRVLYALLLILLATMAYENSAFLYDRLIGSSHPLPELGERRTPQLRQDMLKRLDRALAEASEDFPQYWARFAENRERLAAASSLLIEDGSVGDAQVKVAMVLASMNEFAAHPLIKSTKNLDGLTAETASLQRILKLKIDAVAVEPKPLVFTREAADGSARSQRNLFEYCLR